VLQRVTKLTGPALNFGHGHVLMAGVTLTASCWNDRWQW